MNFCSTYCDGSASRNVDFWAIKCTIFDMGTPFLYFFHKGKEGAKAESQGFLSSFHFHCLNLLYAHLTSIACLPLLYEKLLWYLFLSFLVGLCLNLLSIKSKSHHYFFSYLFICTAGISEYKDKSRGLLRVIDDVSTMGPTFLRSFYLKLLFAKKNLKHLLYQAWLRVLFRIWFFVLMCCQR